MRKKTVVGSIARVRLFLTYILVFGVIVCGCSGGDGGSDGGSSTTDMQPVDIDVSVHWLDRVYDDDEQYYSFNIVAGDVQKIVSDTDSWTAGPHYNGVWSSSNTWAFETTIDVPADYMDFYFIIRKIAVDQEEIVWESENYGQRGRLDTQSISILNFPRCNTIFRASSFIRVPVCRTSVLPWAVILT